MTVTANCRSRAASQRESCSGCMKGDDNNVNLACHHVAGPGRRRATSPQTIPTSRKPRTGKPRTQ